VIPAQLTAGDAAAVAGVDGSETRGLEVGALDGTVALEGAVALGGTGGVLAHAATNPIARTTSAIACFMDVLLAVRTVERCDLFRSTA
jgi:hypothetical protein